MIKKKQKFKLSLYIAGMSRISGHAINNIKKICNEHLKNNYDLEIIDIYRQPLLVKKANVIAAPTLIKKLPRPLKKFIGDLSDTDRILIGLDLSETKEINEKTNSKKQKSPKPKKSLK